jgi:hypothetical protein
MPLPSAQTRTYRFKGMSISIVFTNLSMPFRETIDTAHVTVYNVSIVKRGAENACIIS